MTNRDRLKHPKFGDRIRGIYASESNPQRDGYFVRVVHHTGRTNHGTYYECTDGNGRFWQYPASSTERLPTTDHAAQVEALEAELSTMVNRFLAWRLPDDFAPDGGISYTPLPRLPEWTHDTRPTGTNLLTAIQARAMLEYVLAAQGGSDK